MKKRFLVLFSIMFVFGLFATAFALSGTNAKAESPASCPMQKTQTAYNAGDIDLSNVVVVGDADSCCQPGADCCKGGSCCKMKKKK